MQRPRDGGIGPDNLEWEMSSSRSPVNGCREKRESRVSQYVDRASGNYRYIRRTSDMNPSGEILEHRRGISGPPFRVSVGSVVVDSSTLRWTCIPTRDVGFRCSESNAGSVRGQHPRNA